MGGLATPRPVGRLAARVAMLLWVWCATARAEAPAALGWHRGPGAEACISTIELAQRVEGYLGPVLVSAADAQVSVEGWIEAVPGGFAARFVVSDVQGQVLGERKLERRALDCRRLDEPLSFVLAVLIDPDAALAALPGDLAPLPGADPASDLLVALRDQPPRPVQDGARKPEQPPAPPRAAHAQPKASDGVRLTFGAGVSGAVGPLPSAALGFGADAGLALTPAWQARVGATLWLPQSLTAEDAAAQDDALAEVRMVEAAVLLCPRILGQGPWQLWLCGGARVASFSATPRDGGGGHSRWLVGPALGVHGGLGLTRALQLRVLLEAQSLWPRHRVVYADGVERQQLFRLRPVAAVLGVRLEAGF